MWSGKRDRKGLPVTLSVCWLLGQAGAGTADSGVNESAAEYRLASEEDFFSELPVVVSASRLHQPVSETPAAVTVIDRAMIDASGAVELVDVLRLVPGFQVGHTLGNLITVSAHGPGSPWNQGMQVLVDGHSAYHSSFAGVEWAVINIALVDIERLEVVRGPNMPTYGSNAIQGTINIITRQPFQDRGTFLQGTAGSRERTDGLLRHADRVAGMDYRLTLEHRENSGFSDTHDYTRKSDLSFRGVLNPTAEDELDIHLGYNSNALGVKLRFSFPPVNRDVQSDYQFLRWTRSLDSRESWYLQLSRDHYHDIDGSTRGLVSSYLGIEPDLVPVLLDGRPDQSLSFNDFEVESSRYDLEFQQFLRPGDDLRLVWGLGYHWDELRHFAIDHPDLVTAKTARAFGSLEWRPQGRMLVNLGAMLEDNSLAGTSLSPRLGVNYQVRDGQTVRAAITRAYKNPALLDEYWNALARLDDGYPFHLLIRSQGDLDPEAGRGGNRLYRQVARVSTGVRHQAISRGDRRRRRFCSGRIRARAGLPGAAGAGQRMHTGRKLSILRCKRPGTPVRLAYFAQRYASFALRIHRRERPSPFLSHTPELPQSGPNGTPPLRRITCQPYVPKPVGGKSAVVSGGQNRLVSGRE